MRAKLIVHFMVAVLSITFIFNSCNEPITVVNEESIKQESRVLKKGTTQDKNSTAMVTGTGKLLGYKVVDKDGKKVKVPVYDGNPNLDIQPDKMQCDDYFENVWEFHHYKAKDNKIVGIWPHNNRMQNSYEISKLKNKYGFNYILFASNYDLNKFNLVLNSGWSKDKIMVQILPENYQNKMSQFGSVYAYYLDEPYERNLSMAGMREAINSNAPGSKLIISGYRRTDGQAYYASISDGILFSSYIHWWYCGFGAWCSWPVDPDQRPDWTDMKTIYGNKSFMNWVGAHKDLSEYPQLLGHASNLGLPGIWLYQLQEVDNSEDNILNFCYNAWANGYLRKFEHLYRYYWHCNEPGDPCYCQSHPEAWELVRIDDMHQEREVFYQY